MTLASDRVMRAMTDDGAFRVITVGTSETVRSVLAKQEVHGATARHFADLLTGTILVRETMSPQLRVQGIVKGAGGRGSLVADSRPGGATRGLTQLPAGMAEFRLGPGSRLQVMRTLLSGAIHQGIVDVSDAGGLSEALMVYLQDSEQIISVIAVGTDGAAPEARRAGGYIVQLLPEAPRAAHMIMTERLGAMAPIGELLGQEGFSPRALLDELLYGLPFTVTGDTPISFDCGCSITTLLGTLATLGRGDLAELIEGGGLLEIRCDYCRTEYQVAPERLRALLDQS